MANVTITSAVVQSSGRTIKINTQPVYNTGFAWYSSGSNYAPGTGYATAPTLTFPLGAGAVAETGTATVSGGGVTGVSLNQVGSGYPGAAVLTATVTGGGGTGALIRITPTFNWPNYTGGLVVKVNGTVRNAKVNTSVGKASLGFEIYITVGAQSPGVNDYILPGDVVTITAPLGAWQSKKNDNVTVVDQTAAFTDLVCTNNSNRAANQMDTLSANFNEVPFSFITSNHSKIGVVAFDNVRGNAIVNKVEFAISVNGGAFGSTITKTAMEWNGDPRKIGPMAANGVWEYCCPITPSSYTDKDKIRVRARVYPDAGTDYKELFMTFWGNNGGTADNTLIYVDGTSGLDTNNGAIGTPVQTVNKAFQLMNTAISAVSGAGGQIIIKTAGTYVIPNGGNVCSTYGMVKIVAASGVVARNIIMVPSSTPADGSVNTQVNRLHVSGDFFIDFRQMQRWDITGGSNAGDRAGDVLWLDGVFIENNKGVTGSSDPRNSYRFIGGLSYDGSHTGVHATNSTMNSPVYAWSHIERSMNCTIVSARADIQSNSAMTVNLYVQSGQSQGTSGPHGDGYQDFNNNLRGVIVYGVFFNTAYNYQGFFITDVFDHIGLALVNHGVDYQYDGTGSGSYQCQFRSVIENYLLLNCSHVFQQCSVRGDADFRGKMLMWNCIFKLLVEDNTGTIAAYMDIQGCHFQSGTKWGTGASSGVITTTYGSSGTTIIQYNGQGSPAVKNGKTIAGWRHPGVWDGANSRTYKGAFDMSGQSLAQGFTGAIPKKPATTTVSTSHPLYSTVSHMWGFNEGFGATQVNDLIGTNHLTNISGYAWQGSRNQWDASWAASPFGWSVTNATLRAAATNSLVYPFQLIWVGSITDFNAIGTLYFYGDGGFTSRYHAIQKGTTYVNARHSRFGTEAGARITSSLKSASHYVIVAQFNSASDRKVWCFVDGDELPAVSDTTTVSSVGASRESFGIVDGSTAGSFSNDVTLFALRTLSGSGNMWTDQQIRDFAARPYALIAAPVAGTASVVRTGQTICNATATDATDGALSYSYQWYLSTTNGFTPGAGNIVASEISLDAFFTGLNPATTYYAKLVYTDLDGLTVTSNQITWTTSGVPAPLTAGTATAGAVTASTQAATATDATQGVAPYTYQWYVSTVNGFTPDVDSIIVPGTSRNYTITGLFPSTVYYGVLAYTDAEGTVVYSNQITWTTSAAPALTAGVASAGAATGTTWAVSATDATNGSPGYTYQWYLGVTPGFVPPVGFITGANTRNYTFTGMNPGVTYYAKIRYQDAASNSVISNEITVTTTAPTPGKDKNIVKGLKRMGLGLR